MFSQTIKIAEEEQKLVFLHYRSKDGPDLYVVKGLEHPCFMQFDEQARSWKFLHPVSQTLQAAELSISAVICEYEECGKAEGSSYDGYDFLS